MALIGGLKAPWRTCGDAYTAFRPVDAPSVCPMQPAQGLVESLELSAARGFHSGELYAAFHAGDTWWQLGCCTWLVMCALTTLLLLFYCTELHCSMCLLMSCIKLCKYRTPGQAGQDA